MYIGMGLNDRVTTGLHYICILHIYVYIYMYTNTCIFIYTCTHMYTYAYSQLSKLLQ